MPKGPSSHKPSLDLDSQDGRILAAWARAQAAGGRLASTGFGNDVTMSQLKALGKLVNGGRCSGRQLATALGITPSSVVPLTDRLEKRGLVRRVPDQEDRRVTWIEATDDGVHSFQSMWLPAITRIAEVVTTFTPDEKEVFGQLLSKISDHLEAAPAPAP